MIAQRNASTRTGARLGTVRSVILFVTVVLTWGLVGASLPCRPAAQKLWPRNQAGVIQVPYVFVGPINQAEKDDVQSAINQWERPGQGVPQVVDFFEAKQPNKNCVALEIHRFDPEFPGDCNWPCSASGIGYLGKGESANRLAIIGCYPKDPTPGRKCVDLQLSKDEQPAPSAIAHELGHVLGLTHEHQRKDRGAFVTLVPEPKDHKFAPFFAKNLVQQTCGDATTPYDYLSIMHYRLILHGSEADAVWVPSIHVSDARIMNVTTRFKEQHPGLNADLDIGNYVTNKVTGADIDAVKVMYDVRREDQAPLSAICK